MIHDYANKVTDSEYNMFMSLMHVSVSKHLWDEHFTVLWANDYFYKLIGYGKEEYTALYHNHVDEYFTEAPDAVSTMDKIIRSAYENREQGYEFECQMPTKSGKWVWIRVTGRFTDEKYEGVPVIYTIYTDITSLKEMQLKLEKALHEAEAANRAKSDFLSRMSHDIRTPMNVIVGMSEIASAHLEEPAKIKDCLKKITYSSQHLLSLINDVLDMSKIESGKMTPNMGFLSLPELVENTVTIIQPEVKNRGQEFAVRLHNVKHENFESDALRLRQIFINILSNACKFTPEGGSITMDIEETPSAKADESIFTFKFTDTGMGMKKEYIKEIFDVFTREQDSRVDKTEGSGLGMAITKRIVDMLGGTIGVQSELGKGSLFTVRLPVKISGTSAEDIRLPDKKILIVDDDESACEYAVQVLRECGALPDWTTSGLDALEKIEKASENREAYDIVILDWKMPGMDGMETMQLIREKIGKELPVLMISAYDWTEIEAEAKDSGINGFLQKPFFRSTLVRNLQKCMQGKKPHKPLTEQVDSSTFEGRTFLLVEDNELNLEIAKEFLTSAGAAVETASNGERGVEKFISSSVGYYDLILMDIQMPVMNGLTATRKIRSLSRKDARTIPILAMTADAFTEDVKAAKEAGMDDHLAKPLAGEILNRVISLYLKNNSNRKG